jgi:hypothetical protein
MRRKRRHIEYIRSYLYDLKYDTLNKKISTQIIFIKILI